jgi:hypothetical protein
MSKRTGSQLDFEMIRPTTNPVVFENDTPHFGKRIAFSAILPRSSSMQTSDAMSVNQRPITLI